MNAVWNIHWEPPQAALFKPYGHRQYTQDRDMRALIYLAGLSGDEDIVEIGCNEGLLTANLAFHFPNRKVIGIDSGEPHPDQITEKPSEIGRFARGFRNVELVAMSSNDTPWGRLNPSFVFVDGDHRFEQVVADTRAALNALQRAQSRWVLAWHDYDHPWIETWRGVGKAVREVSESRPVFAIEGTSIAYITEDNLPDLFT